MNKRLSARTTIETPVKLHFFGEQVDLTMSEDISQTGFFVKTDDVRNLDKGTVALVSLFDQTGVEHQVLAEVVRTTEHGAGFEIIDDTPVSLTELPLQSYAL